MPMECEWQHASLVRKYVSVRARSSAPVVLVEFVRIERLLGKQEAMGSTPVTSSIATRAERRCPLYGRLARFDSEAWLQMCGGRTQTVSGQIVNLL